MNEPKLHVDIVRLSATLAELQVNVDFPESPQADLSGKVTGPHSTATSTIVVNYPLRPMPPTSSTRRSAQVVIPEPNLWTEKTQNIYRINVECGVWSQTVEIGLKLAQKS